MSSATDRPAAFAAAPALAALIALPLLGSVSCTDPPEPDPAQILIVGSDHLAQQEERTPDAELAAVVAGLRSFDPDMVVVEYLPPDWPEGAGRDYRREMDEAAYARRWGIPPDSVDERRAALRAELDDTAPTAVPEADRCRLARLHFLARDRVNALYHWLAVDCPEEADSALADWIDHRGEHELARIAFPVARSSGVGEVVSFDYQGDDARWFMGEDLFRQLQEEGTAAERREADSLMATIEGFRARVAAREQGTLMASLRFKNSPAWIEAQRTLYELEMPRLTYDDSAGSRQTANYWLRNERMFDRIDSAAAVLDPARILVVVGAGHKYFLDELAMERGYRWVDPLDYLGRTEAGSPADDD